jgi:hypothetical protein
MLKRLMLWLRIVPPPRRYFRCGTPLILAEPEARERILRQWREEDEHYVAWVEAHPRPKKEWLERARRIRGTSAAETGRALLVRPPKTCRNP